MIFSELYSAYYNAVAAILAKACDHPLSKAELRGIIMQKAFGESLLSIEPALLEERWQLLKADGTTPIRHAPTMPLTVLQRRWLKAITLDPRIRLFPDACFEDPDVEPLFRQEDIDVFDRYSDGDPFEDETYIRHFRLILDAIRNRVPLAIDAVTGKGETVHHVLMPDALEYSEKDDKFRLVGHGSRRLFVNLSRILRCSRSESGWQPPEEPPEPPVQKTVVLELVDRRNALERVLMHFAHFEKQAERLDQDRYRIRIVYQQEDETEILIRVLAFGPMIRVTSPENFTALVKERLRRQQALL